MTETAIAPAAEDKRELALLKAIGFDRLAPEQRELALAISKTYDLDPILRHIVIIDGKPFVTRDALLWIAHRSKQFDGIEVTEPEVVNGVWKCWCSVWRKDWSHVTRYPGRYPTSGGNQKYAPEMCIKVAESMALRRAFNVAAPVAEERWDLEAAAQEIEPPAPRPTLAERAAQRAATVSVLTREPDGFTAVIGQSPSVEASAVYVNAEEVAEGAQPIYRDEVAAGLSVETFRDLCVKSAKSAVAIAKVIETTPDKVGARVKAMSPIERGVLADELGIEWRQ